MGSYMYTFQLRAMNVNELMPQVSQALEKRTELVSRARYPQMWQYTDSMNRGRETHRNKSAGLRSILFIVMGIILFVPGMINPEEMKAALIWGAAAVLWGLFGLWRNRKNRKNPFDRSAMKLLEGKDKIAEKQYQVEFADRGMEIISRKDAGDTDSQIIAYSDFEYVIETEDLFMITYQGSVLALQKQDLTAGNVDEFRNFIGENTEYISLA